jgi:phage terminase large subunit GpA-like protein
MGVDVQGDRLELEVLAHGLERERFSVDYRIIYGLTSSLGDENGLDENGKPTAWRKLAEMIVSKRYRHESGCNVPIEFTLIDAGYRTDIVHAFCRAYERYMVFPTVGRQSWDKGRIEIPNARHKKFGTKLFKTMKDPLIQEVYEDLQVAKVGARFQHFPNTSRYTSAYFKGLVSERRVVKTTSAGKKVVWETPSGLRNEPIDIRCYAIAAFLASQESLAMRAGRTYPIPESRLTFWKTPEEVRLKRKMLNEKEAAKVGFMPQRKKRVSHRGMGGAKTLSKGVT